jgi:type 1 glutamine amidotransferase
VSILKATLLAHGVTAESTRDSLAFTSANLARFGAVVFINTNYRNGAVLGREQEAAFEAFIHAGGGFVGIHNASPLAGSAEIEAVWPWFVGMYGTRFIGHGSPQTGAVVLEDTSHSSTRGLPARFTLKDEWYLLRDDPRTVEGIRVLVRVDASTLASGGKDRVLSWYRPYEGGRVWMTTLGHDLGTFGDANFLAHLRGGVAYAGGWDGVTTARPRAQATKRESLAASDGPGYWRGGASGPYFRGPGDPLWRNLMGRKSASSPAALLPAP